MFLVLHGWLENELENVLTDLVNNSAATAPGIELR